MSNNLELHHIPIKPHGVKRVALLVVVLDLHLLTKFKVVTYFNSSSPDVQKNAIALINALCTKADDTKRRVSVLLHLRSLYVADNLEKLLYNLT